MALDAPTLIEAIMDTRGQLDFVWQFFVTANIAVFAMLFVYEEAVDRLNLLYRMLFILGVGAFDWVNGNALIETYELLHALHDQFRTDFGQSGRFRPELLRVFVRADFVGRDMLILFTHGTAFAVVALVLLWRRTGRPATAKS